MYNDVQRQPYYRPPTSYQPPPSYSTFNALVSDTIKDEILLSWRVLKNLGVIDNTFPNCRNITSFYKSYNDPKFTRRHHLVKETFIRRNVLLKVRCYDPEINHFLEVKTIPALRCYDPEINHFLEAKTIPVLITKGASSSTAEIKPGRKRKMT